MGGTALSGQWTGAALPVRKVIVEVRVGRACPLGEEALAVEAVAEAPAGPAGEAAVAGGGRNRKDFSLEESG